MKTLRLKSVLLEYDYPQVFIAIDGVGCQFVCMIIGVDGYEPRFICTPVSSDRSHRLSNGRMDLRNVFEFPEVPEFYFSAPEDLFQDFEAELSGLFECPVDLLPDSGLFFEHDDEVLDRARESRTTVAYASLSVPESKYHPRIRAAKLSEFLSIYQNSIKHLSRAEAKVAGKAIPKNEDPYEMDVFGTSYGSFTVQLRSADSTDLLGENPALVSAFRKLNEFLDLAEDSDEALKFLLSVKGHAASSLMSLLSFISENDCQLTNRWSTPFMVESSKSRIRVATAQNVLEKCRTRQDLGVEVVMLQGVLDSANVSGKNWKLIVDGVSHSGIAGDGVDLSGIILGNWYLFKCEEKLEVQVGSGREVRTLTLTRFDPVDPM
ncbi:hypothetical protein QYE80_32675 [Pseudomonas tohonis]|jgi:hypothetical protein|nr:hypothetical protein [Pseudomonas tohonis]